MRTWTAILALAASACGGPPERPQTEAQQRAVAEAQAAFEKWRDLVIQGDIDSHYDLYSVGFVSKWLFTRLMSDDPDARTWRESLVGSPSRTDLDIWWEFCRKKYKIDERPDALPYRVFGEPTLKDLYRKIFKSDLEPARIYAQSISVHSVAADPTGVTVMVKTDRGILHGYAMTYERGAWRIDGFRENRLSFQR